MRRKRGRKKAGSLMSKEQMWRERGFMCGLGGGGQGGEGGEEEREKE